MEMPPRVGEPDRETALEGEPEGVVVCWCSGSNSRGSGAESERSMLVLPLAAS
jgi:hypothetical protein